MKIDGMRVGVLSFFFLIKKESLYDILGSR